MVACSGLVPKTPHTEAPSWTQDSTPLRGRQVEAFVRLAPFTRSLATVRRGLLRV